MVGWISWLEGDVGPAYGEYDCGKGPIVIQLVFTRDQWSIVSCCRDKCIDSCQIHGDSVTMLDKNVTLPRRTMVNYSSSLLRLWLWSIGV